MLSQQVPQLSCPAKKGCEHRRRISTQFYQFLKFDMHQSSYMHSQYKHLNPHINMEKCVSTIALKGIVHAKIIYLDKLNIMAITIGIFL